MKKSIAILLLIFSSSLGYSNTIQSENSGNNKNYEEKVPYLKVEHEVVFDEMKMYKNQNGVNYDEYRIMMPTTNIKWMDKILVEELSKTIFNDEAIISDKEELRKKIREAFYSKEKNNDFEENENRDWNTTFGAVIIYLGQKGNIVLFKNISMYNTVMYRDPGSTEYINIDINKKKKLELRDIIKNYEFNINKIEKLLEESYQSQNYDEYSVPYDGGVPENFYFSEKGIVFEFSSYEMTGTFSDNGSQLTIPWRYINPLLHKEYQKNEIEISIFDRWMD